VTAEIRSPKRIGVCGRELVTDRRDRRGDGFSSKVRLESIEAGVPTSLGLFDGLGVVGAVASLGRFKEPNGESIVKCKLA
jgi:hypothetical protein